MTYSPRPAIFASPPEISEKIFPPLKSSSQTLGQRRDLERYLNSCACSACGGSGCDACERTGRSAKGRKQWRAANARSKERTDSEMVAERKALQTLAGDL